MENEEEEYAQEWQETHAILTISDDNVIPSHHREENVHTTRVINEKQSKLAIIPSDQALGDRASRLAARRVSEYRAFEHQQQQLRLTEENWRMKQRKDIRAMHKPLYKQLGIADISREQRFEDAQVRIRREKAQQEAEQRVRWYKQPALLVNYRDPKHRLCDPAVNGAEILQKLQRQRRKMEKQTQQRQATIAKHQQELDQKAKAIVTQYGGEYVRGSYILKKSLLEKLMKKKKEKQEEEEEPQEEVKNAVVVVKEDSATNDQEEDERRSPQLTIEPALLNHTTQSPPKRPLSPLSPLWTEEPRPSSFSTLEAASTSMPPPPPVY